jgi:hypothetical protein
LTLALYSRASSEDGIRKQAPVHCERRLIVLYLFVKLHIAFSMLGAILIEGCAFMSLIIRRTDFGHRTM